MPASIDCDVCGAQARRLPSSGETHGDLVLDFFNCPNCHEGGHIARDRSDDTLVRREGPVFDAGQYTNGQISRREHTAETEVPA